MQITLYLRFYTVRPAWCHSDLSLPAAVTSGRGHPANVDKGDNAPYCPIVSYVLYILRIHAFRYLHDGFKLELFY